MNTFEKEMDSDRLPSGIRFSRVFMALTFVGVVFYGFCFPDWTSLSHAVGKKLPFQRPLPDLKITEDEEMRKRLAAANETKIILAWHRPRWLGALPKVPAQNCGKCVFTFDKEMINNTATGGVIFFFSGIRSTNMPSKYVRNPEQLHIFWTIEPPPNVRRTPNCITTEYEFNATMSYRRTSDFYTPYGDTNAAIKLNLSGSQIIGLKKKGGVALISNCGNVPGPKTRLKLVQKIQSLGFPLEGFGGCFRKSEPLRRGGKEYVERLRQYRFYFSLENSYHCLDYITEKVFRNAMETSVAVPVVWGATRENYESLLPKGSFIFMEDFDSAESLVEYLQYLMKNDTAYLEYFKWHKTTPLITELPYSKAALGFCQICRALHGVNVDDKHNPNYDPSNPPRPTFTDGIAKRYATSVRSFIFEEESKECNEQNENNWKFYKDWKLDEPLQ